MPRFNGPITFFLEVLAQLLWCYFLFGVFYFLFFGAAIALFGGGFGGFILIAGLSASNPFVPALALQVATMSSFRICFWPRFPYAPQILTFLLAMLFGSAIVTIAWGLEQFRWTAQAMSSAEISAWVDGHLHELGGLFLASMIASVAAGSFGSMLFITGVRTAHLWGVWRWVGGLFVGKEAYEDFVERENARLYGVPFQGAGS
jgi:hypothetical protein